MSLEERIIELETRLAFQDDSLQQLSDEVLAQGRLIERLQRQIELLAARQVELASGGQFVEQGEEPPPPHY